MIPQHPLQHTRSLLLAGLFAVISVPLAYFLVFAAGQGGASAYHLGFILAIGLPIAGAVMVLLGVPLVLLMRRRRRLNALAVCGAAALLGAVTMAALFEGSTGGSLLTGAGLGLVAGGVFCAVSGTRLRAS